jgi:Glycine zipper
MSRAAIRWTGGRPGARVAILMLGIALAIAPEAFAWGRGLLGGGGFGGGGGPSSGGGEGSQSPAAGPMYIYPEDGQSPQHEQFDKGQCYSWAVQQSGFDPANPQVSSGPPPVAGAPQGGLFRGAAGGAAIGAIGGAIGGNAGEGAAIGGATGALFGGMRRRRWAEQEESQQSSYMEQQESALNQGRANYNRAFGVCMTGRGYTVG